MLRTLMTSKIHRATVTQADLHYVGSVTIDPALTEAAGLVENEQVTIVDITNGHRLITYVIEGERDSGVIGINGAAAHLVAPGDLVIIIAYGSWTRPRSPRTVPASSTWMRAIASWRSVPTARSPSPAWMIRSTAAPRTGCADPTSCDSFRPAAERGKALSCRWSRCSSPGGCEGVN